jgi:dTDP-4-dehydrorhamnose 3,5-epimerase-like enzyme
MDSRLIVERVQFSVDARGLVIEPITEGCIAAQRNAHAVLTEPGGIRGNHYHQRGTEICVVLGPALVRVREGGVVRDCCVPEGEAFRFTFPPGVAHAFQNRGPRTMFLISFNTVPHDPARPDVVRDVLIES